MTIRLLLLVTSLTFSGCATLKKGSQPASDKNQGTPISSSDYDTFESRRDAVQLETAQSRLQLGDTQGALLLLRRILQRKPDHRAAEDLLLNVLVSTDQDSEAESILRRRLQNQPRDAATHYELGLLLETSGRGQQAAQHFLTAAQLAPQNELYQAIVR